MSDEQKVMEAFDKLEETILQETEASLEAGALTRARMTNATKKDFKFGNKLVGKDGLTQSTF